MTKRKPLLIGLAVFLFLSISYFVCDGESKVLNEAERKNAPGKFIKLSGGMTHYKLNGQPGNPWVVLVHGYSTPLYLWDDIADKLASLGFQVLRFDLYGRGYSDRLDTEYNIELFDTQLFDLLNHLKIQIPVNVIGISMGGAIVTNFAVNHQERVGKVGLIAPFGMPQSVGFLGSVAKSPLLGDYLMTTLGDTILMAGQRKSVYEPEKHQNFFRKYEVQLQYKGYKSALLSTLRNVISQDFTPVYAELGKQNRPTLLIWGTKDVVVPFENHKRLKPLLPTVRFYPLENVGHLPPVENPKRTLEIIVHFLRN